MKTRWKFIAALVFVLVVGMAWAVRASAGAVYIASEGSTSTLASDKVVDGSAYVAGNNVVVQGTVKGDLYCAGNSVRVEGTIMGDVLCAGNTVKIGGIVKGNVRVAGANVTIGGTIQGAISALGGDVVAAANMKLAGDFTGAAGSLTIDGTVGRDMTAVAGDLVVKGTIGRNVETSFETFNAGATSRVGGDFHYSAAKQASLPKALVAGKTTFTLQNGSSNSASRSMVDSGFLVFALLAVAAVALVVAIAMPRQLHAAGDINWGKFAIALTLGFATIVVAPITAILLLVTGFGTIVGYVIFLMWLLLIAVSPATFAYFIGTKVYGRHSTSILLRALVGALLLIILLAIPFMGVVVWILMVFSGVGMYILQVPKLYTGDAYKAPSIAQKEKKVTQ
ncbi:polymer-forming cytoskeletal protein [Candidatus Saccharibacteria bacterium]|nr:polymer-forming cytoskeletal protein [Candidatus Saccharibacteria bacterium]